MESFLLRGLLIGLLFGIPLGAVGAMTIRRILAHGPLAGMISGLGSCAADCLYACAGAFGLTFLSDFFLRYRTPIQFAGGLLILLMGTAALIGKNGAVRSGAEKGGTAKGLKTENGKKASRAAGMFVSSFAVGITNPAAILSFLFAFSYFGISGRLRTPDGLMLVLGIFVGTFSWWGFLAAIVGKIKHRSGDSGLRKLNVVFSVVLILFGLSVFAQTALGGQNW